MLLSTTFLLFHALIHAFYLFIYMLMCSFIIFLVCSIDVIDLAGSERMADAKNHSDK